MSIIFDNFSRQLLETAITDPSGTTTEVRVPTTWDLFDTPGVSVANRALTQNANKFIAEVEKARKSGKVFSTGNAVDGMKKLFREHMNRYDEIGLKYKQFGAYDSEPRAMQASFARRVLKAFFPRQEWDIDDLD